MESLLETRGLTKDFRNHWTFRRLRVLEGLDLQVKEGEIFGLIGPNGAGKTTIFKLLIGLLRPSRGEIWFAGRPLDGRSPTRGSHGSGPAIRAEIGFLPEAPYFYDYLNVQEILYFYARLYGLSGVNRHQRVVEVIEQVGLQTKRRSQLRTLSKGTLQRVGVAQAILNHPRLLILDEPMSGLDPIGRRHMRDLLLSLHRAGSTVIFSSHILPDAEALCERVGILTNGRLREVVDLRPGPVPSGYRMVVQEADADTLEQLKRISGSPVRVDGAKWQVRLADQQAVATALEIVRQCGSSIQSLSPVHPSLEERFLTHVGHERLD